MTSLLLFTAVCARLAGLQVSPDSWVSTSHPTGGGLGLPTRVTMARIYTGSVNLNSDPRVCVANDLCNEPSLQPRE